MKFIMHEQGAYIFMLILFKSIGLSDAARNVLIRPARIVRPGILVYPQCVNSMRRMALASIRRRRRSAPRALGPRSGPSLSSPTRASALNISTADRLHAHHPNADAASHARQRAQYLKETQMRFPFDRTRLKCMCVMLLCVLCRRNSGKKRAINSAICTIHH